MQRKSVKFSGPFSHSYGVSCLRPGNKPINVGTAHGPPFSDGMFAGNTLYIAGQGGDDESGQPVPAASQGDEGYLATWKKLVKASRP